MKLRKLDKHIPPIVICGLWETANDIPAKADGRFKPKWEMVYCGVSKKRDDYELFGTGTSERPFDKEFGFWTAPWYDEYEGPIAQSMMLTEESKRLRCVLRWTVGSGVQVVSCSHMDFVAMENFQYYFRHGHEIIQDEVLSIPFGEMMPTFWFSQFALWYVSGHGDEQSIADQCRGGIEVIE